MTTAQQRIAAADLPARGQPLAGGTFVTRYWLGDAEYALIDLGSEAEFEGEWGKYGQEVPGAASYSDGMANTLAMAETGSSIAQLALALDGAFIPAALELNLLFAAKHAGLLKFKSSWYWSSSQRSAYGAFFMHFGVGNQTTDDKNDECLVRPVRRLLIC